ncbi:MAG: PEGA domain-containing protein [bacterium]
MKKTSLLSTVFAVFALFFSLTPITASAASGSLKVTSTPSGARIFVNDLDQSRTTPATIRNLEEGKKYKVRLEKRGYKNYESSVKIESSVNSLHGDLEREKAEKKEKKEEKSAKKEKEPAKKKEKNSTDEGSGTAVEKAFGYNKMYKEGTYGWLEVSSIPNGAVVYINDQRQVGPTPNKYKFPVGTVKVAVVIKGKASREFSNIKIRAGETTTLETVDFRDEITRPNTRDLLK